MTTMPGHWQSSCDELTDEDRRVSPRTDAATFVLHQQFTRAHGSPRGELTTLVTTLVRGGAFLSSIERHH
jgi:hypothetical protein